MRHKVHGRKLGRDRGTAMAALLADIAHELEAITASDPAVQAAAIDELAEWKANRDQAAVDDALDELERVGVDAVLVGEMLMRAEDPETACRALSGSDGF